VLIYLLSYFLFGAGYIAYMTFMIAYVRDAGGGAAAQSAFWSLIGLSAFVHTWVWRRVLALDRGGLATTIILGVNAIGARFRSWAFDRAAGDIGAGVRRRVLRRGRIHHGASCASTTRRRHGRPRSRPMTIAFGIGQTLGPIAVGAITDAMGSLSYALNVSAAMLALGALAVGVSAEAQAET
jgi:hypothetical protein